MTSPPRFHLAFPVRDLGEARAFYGTLLGCKEGRSSDEWIDFDFFGHQIVAHLSPNEAGHKAHNIVDGDAVPVRHFGVILQMDAWRALAEKLRVRGVEEKPWLKAFGKLRSLRKETARINRIIEEEFERIEPEDWQ